MNPVRPDSKPEGHTLVEVLIAAGVLVLFTTGVFMIYRGVTSSVRQTSWGLSAQQAARSGLAFLREEMQRASYRSECTVNRVKTDENGYFFHIASGSVSAGPGTSALGRWAICAPFTANGAGFVFRSRLTLESGTVVYSRIREEPASLPPGGETSIPEKVLFRDVVSMWFSTSASGVASGSLVQIQLELADPKNPSSRIIEKTAANVDVGVKPL